MFRSAPLLLLIAMCACGGDAASPTPVSVTPTPAAPAPVATVVVSPATGSVIAGQTVQLSVETRDASGALLGGRVVTWSTGDATIATVNATGLVTAVAPGTTAITATSEGKTGSAAVTVRAPAPVATVSVSLPSERIIVGAATETIAAVTLGASGDTLTGRTLAWSSSAPTVASVDPTGHITALAAGTTTLTATSEGKTAAVIVTVEPRSVLEPTFVAPSTADPSAPVFDKTRQGYVPRTGDARQQIVVDENFSVPRGTTTVWDNKIVWVRPQTFGKFIDVAGTLRIHNSLVLWDQLGGMQSNLRVLAGGLLRVENSFVFGANQYAFRWDALDGAKVSFDHAVGNWWSTVTGSVDVSYVNGSVVRTTILNGVQNGTLRADASRIEYELIPAPGTYSVTLPELNTWGDWTAPTLWPGTSFRVTNSYFAAHDVSLAPNTNVTLADTPSGVGIGWSYRNNASTFVDCDVANLADPLNDAGRLYADTTWTMACANETVRFRNSKMTWSWITTFGKVHVHVRNSNLDNPAVEAPGTLEVYDSKIGRVQLTGAGALGYIENSSITRYVQIENAGSVLYVYNVRPSVSTNPFAILELNGGKYQTVTTPGKPWP